MKRNSLLKNWLSDFVGEEGAEAGQEVERGASESGIDLGNTLKTETAEAALDSEPVTMIRVEAEPSASR